MPTDAGRLWTPDELLGPLNAEEARYAPKQLFASGHTEWLQRSPRVAIVGARKASDEGLRRAARLVRFLVKHDATIISGLAEGIDHCAHTTTLDAGGSVGCFGKDVRSVSDHLRNIFENSELEQEATIRKFRIVRREGTRDVAGTRHPDARGQHLSRSGATEGGRGLRHVSCAPGRRAAARGATEGKSSEKIVPSAAADAQAEAIGPRAAMKIQEEAR